MLKLLLTRETCAHFDGTRKALTLVARVKRSLWRVVQVCLKDMREGAWYRCVYKTGGRERGTGVSKRQEGGSVVQVFLKDRREGAWYRCV